MRSTLVVTVALPCSEAWQQMTPTAHGRHCAACAQEVVDFTRKTDAELLAWFQQPGRGATCGRFRLDQLHRPLLPPPAPRWRSWLAAVLALWAWREAAPTGAAGQQRPTQHLQPRPVSPGLPAPPTTIRGQVLAANGSGPLVGATVRLDGSPRHTSTDLNGRFTLELPAPLAANDQPWTVTLLAPGYAPQHLPASAVNNQPIKLLFVSESFSGFIGGVQLQGTRIVEQLTPHGQPVLHLEDWLR